MTGRAVVPSREQLLHLVDRAERGVLGPVEAGLLRRGIEDLAGHLAAAGAKLRQLSEERNTALLEAAVTSPVAVECSFCGAAAGSRCRAVRGVVAPRTPHTARLHAAAQRLAGGR